MNYRGISLIKNVGRLAGVVAKRQLHRDPDLSGEGEDTPLAAAGEGLGSVSTSSPSLCALRAHYTHPLSTTLTADLVWSGLTPTRPPRSAPGTGPSSGTRPSSEDRFKPKQSPVPQSKPPPVSNDRSKTPPVSNARF